jgi:hypothetical protein
MGGIEMTDTKDQSVKDKELLKGLVGKVVKLSLSAGPFFFEDNSQYVLNAQPETEGKQSEFQNSSVVLKEGWKLECTLKNIKAGQLRVYDDKGNDITTQFGGPLAPLGRKARPLVTSGIAQYDKDDQRDVKLRKILDNINEKEVVQVIASNKLPFELLERIFQLELSGENPAYRSRATVIDGIRELIKGQTGIGAIKVEESEEKVTTSRR